MSHPKKSGLFSEIREPTEKMSQLIPAETVGAVAKHTNVSQGDATDTFNQVLTDISHLHPVRDLASPQTSH